MDLDEIIGFDALWDSMAKCRRGVTWKGSVASFVLNAPERIYDLSEELEKGTYKARKAVKFKITKPKEREIISICFRDRVYQRSLNDNVLYPTMTRSFVYDNWACQKHKGTDKARERMKEFLRRMYRKYGTDFYGWQEDIHGYYPNMRHDCTNRMLWDKLEPEIAKRSTEILDGQYAGEVGYNPGSQMVQIVGISALDPQDHALREIYHCDEAGRYMDDTLAFSPQKEVLKEALSGSKEFLEKMGLEVNPKKTRIFHIKDGFTFLGFKFRLTDTGKVIMTLDPKKVKEERKTLRKLVKKAKRGEITKAKVDQHYSGFKNHASKGNNTRMLMRMDAYYKELWRQDYGS